MKLLKGHNVSFHGEVASSAEFMNDKSVMVIPLFSGSGIRMRIIEGMSVGKSIVTTSCGAEGIDYQDKRNIYIADTPEDFAECVLILLKNADLIKHTGENAIENVRKNYNILASTERLLKFYSELTA
jgi:glycosyltransferase involved in cell wall biosynthesis